jgi:transposase-like protein
MAFQIDVFLLMFFLILTLAWLWRHGWLPLRPSHFKTGAVRTTVHRLLKPCTPDDCPACRLASTASSSGGPTPLPVRPWSEVKSRRRAPKRIPTKGFACPNPQCAYFGNTDAHFHALVGDGKHGQAELIQTFRCQACRTTFTSRRNTPLYRLKTPSHQVTMVLVSAGRRARPFRSFAGLRLSTSDHHHLAVACWRARTHPARALLLPSAPPAPPIG